MTPAPKSGGLRGLLSRAALGRDLAARRRGALIVVFVYLSFASDNFLSADNLFNVGQQTAVMAIIAIGMTLVIITAGIDLSVVGVARWRG